MWPGQIPIVQHFWTVGVFPLVLLIRAFSPTMMDMAGLDAQKKPHDEESLLTALKWGREAFEQQLGEDPLERSLGKPFALSEQLAEAEKIGREWHQADKQTTLPKECADKIMARFEQLNREEDLRKTNKALNLMLIPTGYWKDGVYKPVILSFFRNDKGKFSLSEIQRNPT